MIYDTFIIFNRLYRYFDIEKLEKYCYDFLYIYFALILILGIFYPRSNSVKKIMLFSFFIAGNVFYLSRVYPAWTLDEKCFYFSRLFGFFDTIHPYVILIFILIGTYFSKIIKIGLTDFIMIEDNLYLMDIKYFLSFFLGLFIYIPFTIYVNLISPPLTSIVGLLSTNYVLSFYLFEFVIWFQFGIYTGWALDAFIKDYRPSTKLKVILCFIISFMAVLYFLISGQVCLVNEGPK